ncbi:MAG: hypothetical protein R3C44_14485 [Chloroflexota bacterium]
MSYSPSIHYTQNDGYVYHLSEQGNIKRFDPRPVRAGHPLDQYGPAVWAIGQRLMHNYLLPRDCPRVTFYAGPETSDEDKDRFLGRTSADYIIAIESAWLDRVRSTTLYRYSLPAQSFRLIDPIADYWISTVAAVPTEVQVYDDLLSELTTRNIEVRITPSLWPLRDTVLNSTLAFSMIRMTNAAPREPGL